MTIGGGKRALFRCGACAEGVIWEFHHNHSLVQFGGDLDRAGVVLGRQWPNVEDGDAPEDTPANVAKFYEQGTHSLESGNFDAAGMVFRKAVDVATKILDPSTAGQKLVKRIDALRDSGALTADMATWAHEIRLGGNDAAHDDEPFTREECEDLKAFIENFLRYAFTLPSAVKRRSKIE